LSECEQAFGGRHAAYLYFVGVSVGEVVDWFNKAFEGFGDAVPTGVFPPEGSAVPFCVIVSAVCPFFRGLAFRIVPEAAESIDGFGKARVKLPSEF
jgi:hypothetical protein